MHRAAALGGRLRSYHGQMAAALEYCACALGTASFLCGVAGCIQLALLILPALFFSPEAAIADVMSPRTGAPRAAAHRGSPPRAQPAGLLHQDLEQAPADRFERIALARASVGELILLTSDRELLPMTLNLIEQLSVLNIHHHILLARDAATCAAVRSRGRVACVWSTYLHIAASPAPQFNASAGAKSHNKARDGHASRFVPPIERLWLQRHHYVGRAIDAGLNVLLLDSDVLLARSPYPHFHSPPFNQYQAIVLGDSTGAAAPMQINGGVWYIQNASRDGPIREVFRRFDQHVQRAIRAPHERTASLFDQTVLNQQVASVLPSFSAASVLGLRRARSGGPLTGLPSDVRDVAEMLSYLVPSIYWSWSCCFDTPTSLPHPGGSYDATYGYRWASLELQHSDRASRAFTENIAKAPPWLFSAESDMSPPAWRIRGRGVRIDSRGWGAKPPPWVLSHFVCSGWPGSGGREQAMRLWGRWNYDAIGRELPEYGRSWHSLSSRMIALTDMPAHMSSTEPMLILVRLIISLAVATDRTPVLPVTYCDKAVAATRCVWHLAGGRCVQRWPSGCEGLMMLPNEADETAGSSVWVIAPHNVSELTQKLRLVQHAAPKPHTARLIRVKLPDSLPGAADFLPWIEAIEKSSGDSSREPSPPHATRTQTKKSSHPGIHVRRGEPDFLVSGRATGNYKCPIPILGIDGNSKNTRKAKRSNWQRCQAVC